MGWKPWEDLNLLILTYRRKWAIANSVPGDTFENTVCFWDSWSRETICHRKDRRHKCVPNVEASSYPFPFANAEPVLYPDSLRCLSVREAQDTTLVMDWQLWRAARREAFGGKLCMIGTNK